jgi:serine/threonine-protein kinase
MYPDTSRTGHLYLAQEWVPKSRTIVDWSSEEPRPLNIVVCSWVMLAAACGEMARRGICHRDLNAGNVLMTPRGVPKIVDFTSGLGPGTERLTGSSAGHVPGTRASYSPEHCEAILEERAARRQVPFQYLPAGDLHALGVIFYEVLTGEHPFRHARSEQIYESIAREMPERPRTLNPDVPFGLEKVTMKLLQKKPEQRYQSGEEVALDLEALFSTGEDWGRPFRTPPPSQAPARSPTTPTFTSPYVSSAIARAGSRAIVVRPETMAPAPRRPRLVLRVLVAVLVALALAGLFLFAR